MKISFAFRTRLIVSNNTFLFAMQLLIFVLLHQQMKFCCTKYALHERQLKHNTIIQR